MATPSEARRDNEKVAGQSLNELSRDESFSAASDDAQTASEYEERPEPYIL